MTETVTTQILHDGVRNVIVKLTSVSDGVAETNVMKVNIADLVPSCERLRVDEIEYDIYAAKVILAWEGTPNVTIAVLGGGQGEMDFCDTGGLNMTGAGGTGNILLSTVTVGSAYSYTIILKLRKKF